MGDVMTVQEYLSHVSNDEITKRLMLIDQSLMELHEHNLFVVSNILDISIINNEVTLASFKDKVDYLDSGYNLNGDKKDIIELCAIGICAYNHFDKYYSSPIFIKYLIDNIDKYIDNGKVPRIMREYYIEVFSRGNITYLNKFLLKEDILNDKNGDTGRNKGISKTKSTAVGRALSNSNNESAYARVLVLPALIVLIYLIVIVLYYVFYR